MSRKSRRAKPAGAGVGAQHGTSGPAAEQGRRVERLWIAAFCLAAAVRVFLFSAAFPFFNNVDEKAHVDMVVKFARGHWPSRPLEHFDPGSARLFLLYDSHEYLDTRTPSPTDMDFLPLWTTPAFADEVLSKGVPVLAQENNHEVNSPPVYYAVAGAWYDLGRALGLAEGQQLYWIRFLNVPVVVLLVLCAYVFCRDCFPGRTDLRLGVPALVAFIPQDLFYSVNSDVLSPLLCAISLLVAVRWYRRDTASVAQSAVLGLLVALTFLVKYTNMAVPLIFGVIVLLKLRRSIRDGRWRRSLAPISVAVLAAILPITVCLARNYLLLNDALGTSSKVAFLGWSPRSLAMLLSHPIFSPSGFWAFWAGLMETFWRGEFVWHRKPIASPLADGFYAVSSMVLLMAAAAAWRRRKAYRQRTGDVAGMDPAAEYVVWASVMLSLLCLVGLSVSIEFSTSSSPSQAAPYFTSGRLIAGALLPFLILYVDGIAFLLKPVSRTVTGPLLFVALTITAMTLSEWALNRVVFANAYNWFHLP